MDKKAYQIRDIGKPGRDTWNEKEGATCAEWAKSPEGKEVVETDLATNETRVLSPGEAQREANKYNKPRR